MPLIRLPAAGRRETPWKNGGGLTAEVAAAPTGGGFDFDWRVSLATVTASGPFSRFPGVDRVLTVIEGAMRLTIEGQAPVILGPGSPPHAFAGDAACEAEVIAPVRDLNLMVRRDRYGGAVETIDLDPADDLDLDLHPALDAMIVLVVSGGVEVRAPGETIPALAPLDGLRLDCPLPPRLKVRAWAPTRLALIRLTRRSA